MEYVSEVLDRRTGELTTVSQGDWITVTELGELHGVGSREVRTVLRKLEVLQVEQGTRQRRQRLADWVVDLGWGKRIEKKGSVPFDVVGPELRQWIAKRWDGAIAELEATMTAPANSARAALIDFNQTRLHGPLSVQEGVSWLISFFPKLSQSEIARVLEVSQPLVARYVSTRKAQLAEAQRRKRSLPPVLERPTIRGGLYLIGEEPGVHPRHGSLD